MEIEEAIFETIVNNLSILPSGPIPPNPSELLDTKRMDAIIEDLEEYYDLIIFDTPPLSVVTDAQGFYFSIYSTSTLISFIFSLSFMDQNGFKRTSLFQTETHWNQSNFLSNL